MSGPLLYTVEQASAELSIGRSRLFEIIKNGGIETVKIGRSRRIPRAALEAFVARLMTATADEELVR